MKEALLSVQSHPSKIIEEYKNQVLFLVRVIRNGHEFLLFHLMHGHGTMCTGDMSWSSFGSNSVSIFCKLKWHKAFLLKILYDSNTNLILVELNPQMPQIKGKWQGSAKLAPTWGEKGKDWSWFPFPSMCGLIFDKFDRKYF